MDQAPLQADKMEEELDHIDYELRGAFDEQEIDDRFSRLEIATQLQQNFTYYNLVEQMNYYGLEFTSEQAECIWNIMSDFGEKLGILGLKR